MTGQSRAQSEGSALQQCLVLLDLVSPLGGCLFLVAWVVSLLAVFNRMFGTLKTTCLNDNNADVGFVKTLKTVFQQGCVALGKTEPLFGKLLIHTQTFGLTIQ